MKGYWLDLGFVRYTPAFAVQEELLAARIAGRLPPTIILQENPPTFTLGRSGTEGSVLVSRAELAMRGIELIEVNRGGDVTYHGPGQIIASPLLYLGDINLNANQYMNRMEDVLLAVLAEFGLHAQRRADYPGAWLGDEKIGAVGIGVRHGYTFHGISLNVELDLWPFKLINPCGVAAMPVTSMHLALRRSVSMAEVRSVLRQVLCHTFDLELSEVTRTEIQKNPIGRPADRGSEL